MPDMPRLGVSKKITDEEERQRLKIILEGLNPPQNIGFIIRTAGALQTKKEIHKDFHYLLRLWKNIEKRARDASAPATIYQESDLVIRTIRDIFLPTYEKSLLTQNLFSKERAIFFVSLCPNTKKILTLYRENKPLFHKYDIEKEIEGINCKKIPLPRGDRL